MTLVAKHCIVHLPINGCEKIKIERMAYSERAFGTISSTALWLLIDIDWSVDVAYLTWNLFNRQHVNSPSNVYF